MALVSLNGHSPFTNRHRMTITIINDFKESWTRENLLCNEYWIEYEALNRFVNYVRVLSKSDYWHGSTWYKSRWFRNSPRKIMSLSNMQCLGKCRLMYYLFPTQIDKNNILHGRQLSKQQIICCFAVVNDTLSQWRIIVFFSSTQILSTINDEQTDKSHVTKPWFCWVLGHLKLIVLIDNKH